MLTLHFLHYELPAAWEREFLRELQQLPDLAVAAEAADDRLGNVLLPRDPAHPAVVAISAELPRAVSFARRVRFHHPDALILLVAPTEQHASLRRQLGIAPMLGRDWKIVGPLATGVLQETQRWRELSTRRARSRTTLHAVGQRITSSAPRGETKAHQELVSQRFLFSVFTHGLDATVCVNHHQQIVAWNAAAEQFFGIGEATVLGRPLGELQNLEPIQLLAELVSSCDRQASPIVSEIVGQGGVRRVLELSCFPVDEDGNLEGTVIFGRDITARRAAEFETQREREWLRTTLGSIGDAVIATDIAGKVVFMNPVAESLTGWLSAEAAGVPLEQVFAIVNEGTRLPVENPVEKALRLGIIVGLANHTVLIARDGTERPIDDSAAPIRTPGGEVHGAVLVFRDVTERHAIERELLAARDNAERASRAKDQFLAVLSHELRTPLTPALIMLETLLAQEGVPEPMRSDLSLIRRNILMEARLVDDLLDINRISRGKLPLTFEILDLHLVVRYAVDICRAQASERMIPIETILDAPRCHVSGDLARLQQVFWNVLQNAVKFTPSGGKITVHTRNLDPDVIEVRVSDTGIGIDADVLPRVFAAFEQGTQAVTREFGGLGLGLAICRALVELHGGEIAAASEGRGRGSTFSVRLKVVGDHSECERTPIQVAETAPARSLRILLVEDHADTRMILSRLLRHRGHTVMMAASLEEAKGLSKRGNFDLLISDLGLPDGSGLEVMAAFRPANPPGLGIALSGFGHENDLQESSVAGFAVHLIKPVNLQELDDAIHSLTRKVPPKS
jgi:two-component system, chemotaxis family, CheB/CheR fusion protein